MPATASIRASAQEVAKPKLTGRPSAAALPVGGVDGGDARFQLKGGRDAVERLQPQARYLVDVTVQVDEASGHDVAGCVQLGPAGREARADRDHAAVADADVGHLVPAGLGVDHPAAAQHEVGWFGLGHGRGTSLIH